MKNFFETYKFGTISSDVLKKVEKVLKDAFCSKEAIKIAVIGQTGVGKTSTVNALFNTNLPISHYGSCTQTADFVKTTNKKGIDIEIIDMPGLWAGESETIKHWKTYRDILPTVDSAIWIISAGDRALEGMQNALKIISTFSDSELLEHIVFGINKSEHMHPENWDNSINLPSDEQELNLKKFCQTVKKSIREIFPNWNGTIIYYSTKKQFRLEELLEQMLLTASPNNRFKVHSAADPKMYEEQIGDKRALEVAINLLKRGE